MIEATSRQSIPTEWIDPIGPNVGYVKPEFRNQVLETLKKEGAASRARLTERLESGDWNSRLTEEQKQYLKENFDLKNMSWEDYQSLIDKLCEFGALDQEDKKSLHCGFGGSLEMTYVDLSGPTCTHRLETNPFPNGSSFSDWRGDVLGWAKYLSGFQSWDTDSQSWQKTGESLLFEKLYGLLGGISK